jgi:Leucine-rich repeat (LRR) protein
VSISGDEIPAGMFDNLAKQKELVEIKITKIQGFNDDNLQKLTGLKKIIKLTINNSAITDKSVAAIVESFPLLQRLDLSRNISLTDDSIVYIAKLRDLEELVLIYCSFTELWLPELAKLPKLRALDIRGNLQIGNKGLGILAGLPVLKSLKHSSTAVDDGGIKLLTAAKNLETLDLQDFAISDDAGKEFKKIPKLTSLLIYRCTNFGSAGLMALQGKSLKRVTLRDLMSIDDDGLAAFRELSTLKRLYLQELDAVSDEGMRNLIYLKELETLEIRNLSQISDKTTEFIARLPNLKSVSITGTQLTDKSADLLLSLPNLKELNLKNNTSITENAKTKLRNSENFTKLELDE